MKKIEILFILCVVCTTMSQRIIAQCNDFYRQTLYGTNIKACSSGGYTDAQVQNTDNYVRAHYAIQVFAPASNNYNCHSYAWRVSEGGDQVWINNVSTESHNVDNYWLDASFIEVNGQPANKANVKVFCGSGRSDYLDDHSAVTTSDPTIYISKMGCGPVVSHYLNNSPYDFSHSRFFVRYPDINGVSLSCSNAPLSFSTYDFVNDSNLD